MFNPSMLNEGKPLPKELTAPQRILITQFGSTASVVQSIPMAVTLKCRFPYAEIAWLISEEAVPLLLDHWTISRFIIVPKDAFMRLSEIRRIRQRLLAFAPQIVIDPQHSFASSMVSRLSGAKYRIGFNGKQQYLFHNFFHNIRTASEGGHRIERHLELLQPLGIMGSDVAFDMPECEKNYHVAKEILHQKELYGNFALLHISSPAPAARWQEERFGFVAKHLLAEWNLPSLVVWAGNGADNDHSNDKVEANRAETVSHISDGAAVPIPWVTTLVERKSLSKLATIFVGTPTAELQIAAAVGTRCVGLCTPDSASENSPWGPEHRTIFAQDYAKKNNVKKRRWWKKPSEGIETIMPEWVCEKCDEVLSEIMSPRTISIQTDTPPQKKAA